MVSDGMYFMCKTVVVELLQHMQDPQCFSVYIAVPLLSNR